MKIIKKNKEYVIFVNGSYSKRVSIDKKIIEEIYQKIGIIFSQEGSIIANYEGYWIGDHCDGTSWFYLFEERYIGKNKIDFMNEILGYNDKGSGESPYCKTPEDNIKLMNAAIARILYKC